MWLDRPLLDKLLLLCQEASPHEVWALARADGSIVSMDLSSSDAPLQFLSPAALLRLASGEDSHTEDNPWFLVHSHPQGRAVLSARDRLAMTLGGCPAWPFPILVLGLSPSPALSCYEWDLQANTYRRRHRQSLARPARGRLNQ